MMFRGSLCARLAQCRFRLNVRHSGPGADCVATRSRTWALLGGLLYQERPDCYLVGATKKVARDKNKEHDNYKGKSTPNRGGKMRRVKKKKRTKEK